MDETNPTQELTLTKADLTFSEKTFKLLRKALEEGAKSYAALKQEAEGGPEPTQTQNSMGANEKRQIKKASRHPYGQVIVDTRVNALRVITIVDSNDEVLDFFDQFYLENRLSRLLPIINEDSFIGGSGYLELYKGKNYYGDFVIKAEVRSPKDTAVLSVNRANDEFAEVAIQSMVRNGKTIYKMWDSKFEYIIEDTATQGNATWNATRKVPHGFPVCPIISFDDKVQSDGSVKSTIEILKPALETLRIVTAANSQAAYWQGLKQMIITGVDRDSKRSNPTDPNSTISTYDDVLEELNKSDENEAILLPTNGDNSAVQPAIQQMVEANIAQLVTILKETKNTVAGLASIPLHRLDPEATPQTSEGSAQSYLPLNEVTRGNQAVIEDRLLSIYRLWCIVNGREIDWGARIIWASNGTTSLNAMSDTVAKLRSAGIPIEWIVSNVIAGDFEPSVINKLIENIQDEKSAIGSLGAMLNIGQ
jgi:hypothetical protein